MWFRIAIASVITLWGTRALCFDHIGNGIASKWGDTEVGTGAIVTWGYMLDGNADGAINQPDYSAWSASFGLLSPSTEGPVGSGANTVPEPSPIVIAALLFGFLLITRREICFTGKSH